MDMLFNNRMFLQEGNSMFWNSNSILHYPNE